jgi:hypothetical protein
MCPESGCSTNNALGVKIVERRRRAEIHSPENIEWYIFTSRRISVVDST